jgi:Na+/H+ antiporter NhaD/arsenite permease-like protein
MAISATTGIKASVIDNSPFLFILVFMLYRLSLQYR